MKKTIVMIALVATAFASCTSGGTETASTTDSTMSSVIDSTPVPTMDSVVKADSTKVDSTKH